MDPRRALEQASISWWSWLISAIGCRTIVREVLDSLHEEKEAHIVTKLELEHVLSKLAESESQKRLSMDGNRELVQFVYRRHSQTMPFASPPRVEQSLDS